MSALLPAVGRNQCLDGFPRAFVHHFVLMLAMVGVAWHGPSGPTAAARGAEPPEPLPPVTGDRSRSAADPEEDLLARLEALEAELKRLHEAKPAAAPEKPPSPPSSPDDGRPTVKFGGQVQGDAVSFGQDAVGRASVGDLQDGVQFRRVRIGARGRALPQVDYALGVDFALANQPSFLDNYVEMKDIPWLQNVRIGHYFEPFSLERITQNFNNTFMERSLVDTFAPARNMGVMAFGTGPADLATWQIGTFRTNSDNVGNDSFDSGQSLTLRGTWLPWWDGASNGRGYFHLGAAYSYRDAYEDRVRFRNTPEIRKSQPLGSPSANPGTPPFAPIFVDTGNIPADAFQLFDPEFSLVIGPFSLQSEYAFAAVDQIDGPPLFFDAFMVQASYFLTGEHRPYDRKKGIQTRMTVNEPFVRPWGSSRSTPLGLGAWEIALRFSTIDLNDENILGNDLTDFTAGLNWYLSPYARAKFNYILASLDDPSEGRSLTDIYGMRFDFDF